ncbi:MAG: ankyrin repeat domain-containing protein [Gammaproteobacteria bacterium]
MPLNSANREKFTCSITHLIMREPVTAADGQKYEKEALEYWFAQGKNTSPNSNVILRNKNSTLDELLEREINAAIRGDLTLIKEEEIFLPYSHIKACFDAIVNKNLEQVMELMSKDYRPFLKVANTLHSWPPETLSDRSGFHLACECSSLEIIAYIDEWIKQNHLSEELAGIPNNWNPRTLSEELLKAVCQGDINTCSLSLQLGAPIHYRASKDELGLKSLGLLHWAVFYGSLNIVNLLLQHGIVVDATDSNGRTALHFACDLNMSDPSTVDDNNVRRLGIITKLIQWRADVNKQTTDDGATPLHYCAQNNFIDGAIKLLMDGKAKTDIYDNNNKMPLCIALNNSYFDLVKLFAKTGVMLSKEPTTNTSFWKKGQKDKESYLKYLQSLQSASNYLTIERLEEKLDAKTRELEQLKERFNMLEVRFNSLLANQPVNREQVELPVIECLQRQA